MNLANFIYKEGDRYYFDTENYTDENSIKLSLEYEDGDRIMWKVNNVKHSGVLRETGANNGLFLLEKVTIVK
jgi:hypothetical protein